MKKILFHGTTLENARSILSGGEKTSYTWTVSNDDMLYFWCPYVLNSQNDEDDSTDESRAIQYAFESGQITVASAKTPQDKIIVLRFEIPEEEVDEDYSCQNMEGAFCMESKKAAQYFTNAFFAPHNSRLDAFVISSVLGRELFAIDQLDQNLIEAAEIVSKMDVPFINSLLEFDYKPISKKEIVGK
jgi:hypothetical protein